MTSGAFRRQVRLGLAMALAVGAFVVGGAQDQSSAGAIRLDVVVSDRLGHALLGLTAPDFQVIEDGIARPVARVEFRRRGGPDPPFTETDQDAERTARQPGTRVFAFFLDELHVSAPDADLVRKTIAAFIEENLSGATSSQS